VSAGVVVRAAAHATTAISTAKLAEAKSKLGRLHEAEQLLLEVLKVRRRVLPSSHCAIVQAALQLASCLKQQKRHAAARELLKSIGAPAKHPGRARRAAAVGRPARALK
jgi:uncharacterized protein (DUF2267 family)